MLVACSGGGDDNSDTVEPLVHDIAPAVETVGEGLDASLVGRAAVGEGFRSCEVCVSCRRGEATVCEAPYEETGFTHDWAWADHLPIPARLRSARRRVVLTGIPDDDDHLSNLQLVTKQLTVATVFGTPSRAWVHAVRAFAAGILDPGILVIHEFVLEDADAALRAVTDMGGDAVKILLHP